MKSKRLPNWAIYFIWLVLVAVVAIGYPLLNVPRDSIHDLKLVIDNWIPLVPFFVIPYISWYVLLALTIFRFAKTDTRMFGSAALAVIITLLSSYVCYIFYQTEINRPDIQSNDFFSVILKFIYEHDNPYAAFPSTHTSLSTLCALLWSRTNSSYKQIIIIWCITIIASTVLVKQHYFLDILGGLAVAAFGYICANRIYSIKGEHR